MSNSSLSGKTVVITGASSGIGEATAEAFAREGARLVLAARDPAALEAVAQRCRELGADARAVPTDVTDATAVKTLAERAVGFGGGIDVWFSNVGVGAVGLFHETPIEAHEQVIRANLMGHINDAHAVVPLFLHQGRGVFINMISLGGFAAAPYAVAYSASKFGLKGFSEALRGELSPYPHIHVCDIYPAFIDTPGIAHGANYAGRALSAPPPVYDARKVARAVVDVARRPRNSVTVGSVATGLRLFHAVAPNLNAALMARYMGAYFSKPDGTPASDGNLFSAPRVAGGIDGGFKRVNAKAGAALAVTAGVLGAAALGVHLLRGPSARRS